MRALARQSDDAATAVQGLLGPAAGATGELRAAAPGWAFLASLGEMTHRWETLNKLLRDELGSLAANTRAAADDYDRAERAISEGWRRPPGR
jgi:hypothetical protein